MTENKQFGVEIDLRSMKDQRDELRRENRELKARLKYLVEAGEKATRIIDRNLYRQSEKIEDASSILKDALAKAKGEGQWIRGAVTADTTTAEHAGVFRP